ncbi:MAG: ATP-binding protein [Planctomycetes bacterium]|nr:ATP-binding protein [Planctomycetota bacterium]
MNDRILSAIREKLGDAISFELPPHTPRDVDTAEVPGKVRAVIGMRRAGKTTFLFQCLADRLAAGIERERLLYFNFEDERLEGLQAADLGVLLDEYYRSYPQHRRGQRVTWCFDEIQLVPGWEKFIRRMLDSEKVEIFVSGSSAKMLSREIATTLRGRALETVITPFSLREFGRAHGRKIPADPFVLSAREVSAWEACFESYLEIGGFPEASRADLAPQRAELLQGYVESVLFRDVAERHGIANLVALRAFVRQLVRQPARSFSVSKMHADFRSRGIGVAKETLLAFLDHLEDAFLCFTLPVATDSERRRQVNPRKLYLADHGLAAAHQVRAHTDRGFHVENLVACELLRRGHALAYVKTSSGREVDFLATTREGEQTLVQVVDDLGSADTRERELAALAEATEEHPDAERLLLVSGPIPRGWQAPKGLEVQALWRWLLRPLYR